MAKILRIRESLVGRMAFVTAIQLSWVGATLLLREREAPLLDPLLSALAMERFFTQKGWFLLSAVLFVFSLLFLLRIRELLSAAIIAGTFCIISVLEHSIGYPQHRHDLPLLILPGSLLMAWAIGQGVFRSREGDSRDHLSMELTRGTLAGSLFLAGLAKVRAQGWMDPLHQQAVVLERIDEQALPAMAPLQEMIAAHPELCAMGGGLVVISQLSACLFVIPRFRKPIAVAVLLGFAWCALILNLKSLVPALLLFAVTWHSLTGKVDEPMTSAVGSP